MSTLPDAGKAKKVRKKIGWRTKLVIGLACLLSLPILGAFFFLSPPGRELGMHCLARLGPPAVPLLRQAMDDENHWVRLAAIDELRKMGPEAVPSLLQSLEDEDG